MHECPNKTLRALIVSEDEVPNLSDDSEFEKSELTASVVEISDEAHFSQMELPFYSVGGISSPKTMKLAGTIHRTPITVMMDSGPSYNFISGDLVSKLQLKVNNTPLFDVKLGDGHKVQTIGRCKDVPIHIGEFLLKVYCYIFSLRGVDLIFGWFGCKPWERLGQIGALCKCRSITRTNRSLYRVI